MKRINVLILTNSLNIGGAEKHIYHLVSNITKEKFNFIIVCLYGLGEIGKLLFFEQGIKIYHGLMRNKYDVLGVWKLMRIMSKEKIDIAYIVLTPLTLFLGILCAKLTGIRACITRSVATYPTGHIKRVTTVNFLILNSVDKIIAQCRSHREYLIQHDHADPEKIIIIYNCVDIKRFNKPALKKPIGIPLDVSVVGTVGRLVPQKGHAVFLKAAKIIIDSFPAVHFLIIGDGSERKTLERLARELSIQRHVVFLGMIQDVPQIISLLDVAVLTSRSETFSNVILEYMAASKPVVATKVDSIAEQIKDRETGYLVPHEDPFALAEAILKLLKNRNLARKMGEAGRARVEEKFTIQRMIAKYDSLFEDLVGQSDLELNKKDV